MIGSIEGRVLYSDGEKVLIHTPLGVGYECFCSEVIPLETEVFLYTGHIVRENEEKLFAFKEIEEKWLFEKLIDVKGVGPKSAYILIGHLGFQQVLEAIVTEQKNILKKAPGIGPKAAAQIILDLADKIKDWSQSIKGIHLKTQTKTEKSPSSADYNLISETVLACEELGFKEKDIIPLANKALTQKSFSRPEELVAEILRNL